jgi:hypothetical protein
MVFAALSFTLFILLAAKGNKNETEANQSPICWVRSLATLQEALQNDTSILWVLWTKRTVLLL